MNKARAFRLLLIAIAGFGCLAGARLSLQHLQHGEVCPMLGPIPACFIVFAGYLFVVFTAIGSKQANAARLFYIGWWPVFLLALIGVFLELTRGDTCPSGPMNIPQCFFSLAMVFTCLVLFKLIKPKLQN